LPFSFAPGSTERSLRYGGWLFSAPTSLSASNAPACPGLFAVQVVNPTWTPCPFEPIYFDHAADLAVRAAAATHQAFGRWIAHPRAGTGLFVSYAALPCTSVDVLKNIVAGLVSVYRPAANMSDGPSRGLLGLAG
jgi:hypothetical protein